jgi:hypothetical protein
MKNTNYKAGRIVKFKTSTDEGERNARFVILDSQISDTVLVANFFDRTQRCVLKSADIEIV